MFVTSKHMVGDMKLGDAGDGSIQWWECSSRQWTRLLRGTKGRNPFAKVQIMFDDMEGWCFEQGKNGETMQTLFWGQLKPRPRCDFEALLATLEQWWKHQNSDDIRDDKELADQGTFEFDFMGWRQASRFRVQGSISKMVCRSVQGLAARQAGRWEALFGTES